jgi:hypothetical protein
VWGTDINSIDVSSAIRSKPRNALVFYVYHEAFQGCGGDPAPGVDDKFVEIEYSFPGWKPMLVRRKQGEWVFLPEDPHFIETLTIAPPWTHFTVQKTFVEHENLIDSLKESGELLVVLITNDSASDIEIMSPVWKSDDVKLHHPLRPGLQLEDHRGGGWRSQSFEIGLPQRLLVVKPGVTFRCFIPLRTPRGDGVERRLQKGKTGKLVFPANIDNELRSIVIDL